MFEWAWVALGYGATALAMATYLISLTYRWARARRRMGEQR
ncbi:tumor necrosis factor receptor family protein [Saccharomonospora glauca]|uniref:Heme exporter protein D n=2 Tax=Saccharomonospora TaxID=1851 RepID=I1D4G3_9PSEU|nr:hypothetical protein [Saccharomonospora glauca]EHY87459.1 hypothetical protein SacazDRAFT_00497 [Saccharomonospora azurea NA-128]EIE99837.1 hypothetical protein SacglDRAFT_02962 [Saccharomonospora glauca K62]